MYIDSDWDDPDKADSDQNVARKMQEGLEDVLVGREGGREGGKTAGSDRDSHALYCFVSHTDAIQGRSRDIRPSPVSSLFLSLHPPSRLTPPPSLLPSFSPSAPTNAPARYTETNASLPVAVPTTRRPFTRWWVWPGKA